MADKSHLRIAHLTTIDDSLWYLLKTELEFARAEGHVVFGLSGPGTTAGRLQSLDIEFVQINSLTRSWNLWSDIKAFLELWRILPYLNLDVLHTHTPKAGVIGRFAGRMRRVKVVVNTCHGLPFQETSKRSKKFAISLVESMASYLSDAELFQNFEDTKYVKNFRAATKFQVVGNGIDISQYSFSEIGRRRLRSELGVTDEEILVGGVGRIVREKGIEEFGKVALQISRKAKFVWAGSEDPAKHDALPAKMDGVQFLGARSDMSDYYSALDIFFLPSHREGLSRASMEAASCGRAIVASDIRGCREIGANGVELLLVPVRNVTKYVEAINHLMQDSELRKKLGDAAHERVLREFDQTEIARKSISTYEEVLMRKSKKPRNGKK